MQPILIVANPLRNMSFLHILPFVASPKKDRRKADGKTGFGWPGLEPRATKNRDRTRNDHWPMTKE